MTYIVNSLLSELGAGPSAEDVSMAVKELMDSEDLETIILGGKSWGGGKAAEIARKHPGRITRLVLCAPAMSEGDAITMPTLLAYCEDDGIGRRAQSKLSIRRKFGFHSG